MHRPKLPAMMKKKETPRPIPETIVAPDGVVYKRGQYLGKGGFARCYELIDKEKNVFAGKAVAKAALVKPSNKEKVSLLYLLYIYNFIF